MARLLAHELALQFNWSGKGGAKQSFHLLHLKSIVSDAVRCNVLTAHATDAQTEVVMKHWLRFAGDRHGGRKNRSTGRNDSSRDNL